MKRVLLTVFLCIAITGVAAAKTPAEIIDESILVLEEMTAQYDVAAMAGLVKQAKGVAIFPSVLKAGFVLGGRYGEGLVLRRDNDNWYGPYFVTIKGVSYGLQVGVQSTALVMVINNERGLQSFTGDKVTLGGEVSVAAGPLGRQAGAATDTDFKAEIYSYSMSKGAFAGMSLEGSIIEAAKGANLDYWGSDLTVEQIFKKKATDSRIKELVAELNNLAKLAD
ncbi:MAG: lipid-binding SYLF domain-containing protein [Firmicutes bacterium]|nr:lipid-binding SYLF domain-containing protein [Bacillota bacterium]